MANAVATYTVYTRENWADAWASRATLVCDSLADEVAPAVGQAQLHWLYGRILEHGATEFAEVEPLDLLDRYVRIFTSTGYDWVGVVTDESRDHGGDAIASDQQGIQRFTVRDLKHLLDRKPIRSAPVFGSQAGADITAVDVGWLPKFNERHPSGGTLIGNRSSAKCTAGHYYFSTAEAEIWTAYNLLELALQKYAPEGVDWVIGSPYNEADLDHLQLVSDANGLTAKRLLDALIDRKISFTWFLKYDADNNRMEVCIVSSLAGNVTVDSKTYYANGAIVAQDISSDAAVDQARTRIEASAAYDKVRVEGGPIVVCFSGDPQATFETSWTEAEEDAYLEASVGDADYAALQHPAQAERNDTFRKEERFARVFSQFRLPDFWDAQIADVVSGDPIDVAYSSDETGAIGAGGSYPANDLPRPILGKLPLLEGTDYTQSPPTSTLPSDAQPAFRKPFALLKAPDGSYCYPDKPPEDVAPEGSFEVVEREGAFRIKFSDNHVLALDRWTDAQPTDVEPIYNYDDMIVTIAIPLDNIFYVEEETDLSGDTEYTRECLIRVPDAQAWVLAEGTVVGLASDGTLLRNTDELLIRADTARLRAIAGLAAAFLGKRRAAGKIGYSEIVTPMGLGEMLGTLTTGQTATVDCNALVTRVTINFAHSTSSYAFGFWDVDWARIVEVDALGTPTLRAMLQQIITLQGLAVASAAGAML